MDKFGLLIKIEKYKAGLISFEDIENAVEQCTTESNGAKPIVVRRLESCMSKFGEAHNMLARTELSKEDYQPISTLLASAKVELFNIYYELKNNQL